MKNLLIYVECSISRSIDITKDGHVNVRWLSITWLQVGVITDMLPQSGVYVNIGYIQARTQGGMQGGCIPPTRPKEVLT